MTQVEQVRRRMVESLHAKEIDRIARQMNWRPEAFVDLLLLCDGDIRRVNQHWRALRTQPGGQVAADGELFYRQLFDYIAVKEREQ